VPELPDRARSLLFVPGDRPERFDKATASGADLVVIDLEDAVAPEAKEFARQQAAAHAAAGHRAAVRINAVGTPWHEGDVAALAGSGAAVVMLPKAIAGPGLGALGRTGASVIALVETAAGILDARAVASTPGVCRLAFGSFDLAAELGIDPLDEQALLAARTALVLGSAAAGLPAPVDGVRARIDDDAGLRAEAEAARRLGFTGKLCIHPRQVPIVRAAFAPTADQVAWARRVVSAADGGRAVAAVDGSMVDKPVLDRARRVLDEEETG
jgi:citrate lyase subunit beta / citryl-CoA lyase